MTAMKDVVLARQLAAKVDELERRITAYEQRLVALERQASQPKGKAA